MKKIFIAVLAVAAMASCATDEIVNAPKGAAIGFGDAFVENVVRASVADYTDTTLDSFGVYGSVQVGTDKGLIFNNEAVTGTKGRFTYTNVQYWVPSAVYYFVAIAPYNERAWTYTLDNGKDAETGTISFNNETAAQNQDLLYAYCERKTAGSIDGTPDKVAFNFYHILSRVKFTFVNGFASTSNITLKVTDVHITNSHESATLEVDGGILATNWAAQDGTLDVNFNAAGDAAIANSNGEAETEHHYLIPDANAADAATKTTYNVTFKVELIQAGVTVGNYDRTATVAVNLQKGCSYDITATLTQKNVTEEGEELEPIVFDVNTVSGWTEGNAPAANIPETVPTPGN